MAVFRNKNKKRKWESSAQKKERKRREFIRAEDEKWERLKSFRLHGGQASSLVVRKLPERLAMENSSAAGRLIPLTTPKEEAWAEYFGLKIYHLQKWLRSLWATANFRRPSVRMTMRYLKEGGRHEIVAH